MSASQSFPVAGRAPRLLGTVCLIMGVGLAFELIRTLDERFAHHLRGGLPPSVLVQVGVSALLAGFGLWSLRQGRQVSNG